MKIAFDSAYSGRVCLLLVLLLHANAETSTTKTTKSTIPRSTHYRTLSDGPPWNPSPQIDEDGFLKKSYFRVPGEWEDEIIPVSKVHHKSRLQKIPVRIRQVPGDGNCLFHSLSVCLRYVENGTHFSFVKDMEELRKCSRRLRQQAIDVLQKRKGDLFLQGEETLTPKQLVDSVAEQHGCSAQEYCETMRQERYWGGGPEIVALCNYLKRPIHVYELYSTNREFRLRRMACFGSPKFDQRGEALHILSADSRFPDVAPGRQRETGDHFLAVFPEETIPTHKAKQKVRGGARNLMTSSKKGDCKKPLKDQARLDDDKSRPARIVSTIMAFLWNKIVNGVF